MTHSRFSKEQKLFLLNPLFSYYSDTSFIEQSIYAYNSFWLPSSSSPISLNSYQSVLLLMSLRWKFQTIGHKGWLDSKSMCILSMSSIYTLLGNIYFTLLNWTQTGWKRIDICCYLMPHKKKPKRSCEFCKWINILTLTTFDGSNFFLRARSVMLIPL